jgi:hypothetical protein
MGVIESATIYPMLFILEIYSPNVCQQLLATARQINFIVFVEFLANWSTSFRQFIAQIDDLYVGPSIDGVGIAAFINAGFGAGQGCTCSQFGVDACP